MVSCVAGADADDFDLNSGAHLKFHVVQGYEPIVEVQPSSRP
jgi:hypothetical protein